MAATMMIFCFGVLSISYRFFRKVILCFPVSLDIYKASRGIFLLPLINLLPDFFPLCLLYGASHAKATNCSGLIFSSI